VIGVALRRGLAYLVHDDREKYRIGDVEIPADVAMQRRLRSDIANMIVNDL
jgi:hypothetical protein